MTAAGLRTDRARRPRHALTWATAGLAAVAAVAAGVVVGAVFVPEPAPSSVVSPPGERTVSVTSRVFDDARQVVVAVELAGSVTLMVPDSGRVTRTVCVPGAVIASGGSPITIDDRPVIALATAVPLWRDLGPGMSGEDVRALQVELARLGHSVAATGTFGEQTRAAVSALLSEIGVDRPSGRLAVASVMWLPAPQVRVDSCEVELAEVVSQGPYATVAGSLAALRVSADPSAGGLGDRVLRWGDLAAPIGRDGRVTDAEFLGALAASQEFAFATSEQGQGTMTLQSALAEPLAVVVVPPAAIFEPSGGMGCVVADGQPRRVSIVASSLGQTMVTFDDVEELPSRVLLPAVGDMASPCR